MDAHPGVLTSALSIHAALFDTAPEERRAFLTARAPKYITPKP